MKELNERIQELGEEVSDASWEPERVREIATLALQALADIAVEPGGLLWDGDKVHKDMLRALSGKTPEQEFEERIRATVAQAVCNVMNYPTDIGPRLLGRDLSAVVKHVSDEVLEVVFAETVRRKQVEDDAGADT